MTSLAEVFPVRFGGYWGSAPGGADIDALAIRNGDVGTTGSVNWASLPVRGFTAREVGKAMVRVGDILLTTSGNCGNVAFVAADPDVPTLATNFVRVLRVDPARIDARYAFHFLRTRRFRDGIAPFVRGATIKNLSVESAFGAVEMPVPPLPEQRRIAAILDEADSLRAKRHRALTHLDDLTRSIFVDMFGDPVRNPYGLKMALLSELGTLDRGVSRHRPRNDPALLGGRHPLIQTGDVAKSGGYITSFSSTYSDLGLAQSKIWPAGTLCITIAANIAKTGILTFDACFPDSVVGFSSDRVTTTYVRVWLGFLQAALEAAAPQSAQKNINLAILRALPVPMPHSSQMADFSARVDAVERQLEVTRVACGEEAALVLALQERAFSGAL